MKWFVYAPDREGKPGYLVKPSSVPTAYWKDYEFAFKVGIKDYKGPIIYSGSYLLTEGTGCIKFIGRDERAGLWYWVPERYLEPWLKDTKWGEYSL